MGVPTDTNGDGQISKPSAMSDRKPWSTPMIILSTLRRDTEKVSYIAEGHNTSPAGSTTTLTVS
jgi:hypothetical protein